MSYPKGDLRRAWVILGAIDALEYASTRRIAENLGLPISSVHNQIQKLCSGEIPGLVITHKDGSYVIESWGEVLNASGVRQFYTRHCASR